ncbi:YbjQ family protein [Chloroflexota bacterium]
MKVIRLIAGAVVFLGFFTVIFAGVPWYLYNDPALPWWLKIAIYALIGGILVVLLTVAAEQVKNKAVKNDLAPVISESNIVLQNSAEIPGHTVTEVLGLVQGHTIFAIWLGRDLSALVRLIMGGELIEYTDMMGKARKVAISRMMAQAQEMGADAIINVRFTTTSVVASAAELLAYGTAVKTKKL